MRVLHVDTSREWRGGQVQLSWVLHPEDGVVVRRGSPLDRHLASVRAAHPRFWLGRGGLATAVLRFRPDLVAVHTSGAHLRAEPLRRSGVPVVVHRRLDFPLNRRSRRRYAGATGVVAVSQAVRHVLLQEGVDDARIRVVYDGVPASAAPPEGAEAGERDDTVLAVGALVPHKGHETLVRAAALSGRPVEIAGTGPLLGDLRALSDALGAPVRFIGARDDIPQRLLHCGVFCHPSVEEGLGQVVLEARAAGCRIVASRVGGVPEVAGAHALLVPPRRPDLLAEALEAAFRRPPPPPERPVAFTAETLCDRTRAAYASLMGRTCR